ncbi:MAG: SCO family protein [Pirellulales bacterium]|nr:SCO family protein [Pirellulales bacterium]
MKVRLSFIWAMLLVAAVFAYGIFKLTKIRDVARSGPRQEAFDYWEEAKKRDLRPGEFVLTDQAGNLFASSELRDKVWVLSTFFSTCPSHCLTINQTLAKLHLRPELHDITFLSVSCSPILDTPDVLREYATRFNADTRRWKFLTGDFAYILRQVAQPLHLIYENGNHNETAVVVGRDGRVRKYVNLLNAEEVDRMMAELPKLAAEVNADQSRSPASPAQSTPPRTAASSSP